MAELTDHLACCSTDQQASCCEPQTRWLLHPQSSSCGCAASETPTPRRTSARSSASGTPQPRVPPAAASGMQLCRRRHR